MGASERIEGGAQALSVLRDEVSRRQAEWRAEERARRCPTGLPTIDGWLEGGFGRGLVSVLAGVVGSGRTSLVARSVALATQAGEPCAWVDPAGSLSASGLVAAGVRLDRLLHVQPPRGDTFWAAQLLARCAAFSLVVVDLDGWVGTREGPSTSTWEAALHRLAEAARTAGPAVVLLADTAQPLPAAFRARLVPGFAPVKEVEAGGAVRSLAAFRRAREGGGPVESIDKKAGIDTDVVTPLDEGLLRGADPRARRWQLSLSIERARRAPPSAAVVPPEELVTQAVPPTWSPPPTTDARGRPLRPFVGAPREGFGEVVVRPLVPEVHTRAPSRFDPDRQPPPGEALAGQWTLSLPLRPRNVPRLHENQPKEAGSIAPPAVEATPDAPDAPAGSRPRGVA